MAGAIALMMDLRPSEIAYCVAAVNLPDQLETVGRVRVVRHRTWTHELFVWLLPLVFLRTADGAVFDAATFLSSRHTSLQGVFVIHAWVLLLPCILHLVGDVLTPAGIKIANQKVSLGLFPTGHPLEYLISVIFGLVGGLYLCR
jgi:hypothetical protein